MTRDGERGEHDDQVNLDRFAGAVECRPRPSDRSRTSRDDLGRFTSDVTVPHEGESDSIMGLPSINLPSSIAQ